jgi:hypothetical protein
MEKTLSVMNRTKRDNKLLMVGVPNRKNMNIDQLFNAYSVNIEKTKIKMIRHVLDEEIDWVLIKRGYFREYQSLQVREDVINREYILSFLVDEKGRTIFKGIFQVFEKQKYTPGFLPKECEEAWWRHRDLYFYTTERLQLLEDLIDRMVIDWGKGKRQWAQNYHNKEIIEILPHGFLEIFPGYLDVSLERNQLETIFRNQRPDSEWRTALSKVYGVYLILDEVSGRQYIGSAYGKDGIWGRWNDYVKTKHGNNKKIVRLLDDDPERYKKFRYSIIEVLPNTLTKDEVIYRERKVKEKLGTRAFGLNLN